MSLEKPQNRIEAYLEAIANAVTPAPQPPINHLYKHLITVANGEGENATFAFYSAEENEYSVNEVPDEDLVLGSPIFYAKDVEGTMSKCTSTIGAFGRESDYIAITFIDGNGSTVNMKLSDEDAGVVFNDSVIEII